jgi:solute carrier family 35 (adenosine 3'-phospho 5'-phosphosulfate transporter), member B3
MQELIQYEFHTYQLPLNVMLGYFEVFGVCFFTYLERYVMIVMMTSRSSTVQHHHQQLQQLQNNTTMEEGTTKSGSSSSNSSNADQENKINNHIDHAIVHNNNSSISPSTRKAPLSVYPFLTLCLLSSSALSNLSLNYINFPTKVVFRSCKLLPTMVIATLLHPNKKKFTMIEYICATIVCLGLICFGMAEFQTQPTFHPIGILFVSLSVFADALLPNAQERVFVQYHAPRSEVTFYTNLFTLMIMTITTFASGDLLNCFHFMYEHSKITIYIFIYTIISYIAISCHMNVVHMYGGVAAVLVATGRKAMTLIVSFLLFPKVYTIYYPIGTILVLSGLTWASLSKVYSKNGNGKKSKKSENTDSVVVPLLSMKTHRSDIMNDDDGKDSDHRNSNTMNMNHTVTIPQEGR